LASRPLFVKTETGSDHARREALASRADAVDHHVVAATSAGDLMILPPKAHTMTVPPPILASFLFAGCFAFAFTFGLLHGFGFASALSEVGLPQSAIPVALLFFNVGVEVGQLLFIASVFAVIALARRSTFPAPQWAQLVPPYAIGSVAAFWIIQRIAAF